MVIPLGNVVTFTYETDIKLQENLSFPPQTAKPHSVIVI